MGKHGNESWDTKDMYDLSIQAHVTSLIFLYNSSFQSINRSG